MAECQHYIGPHLSSVQTWAVPGLPKYVSLCTTCMLTGDYAENPSTSLQNFWKKAARVYSKKGVVNMPTEDYKRGIEQATQPLYLSGEGPLYGHEVNQKLTERRKNLLTKKVTKWINIWETGPSVYDPASVRFGTGVLYDDKSTAEANVIDPSRRDFLGTYPIEIETEI